MGSGQVETLAAPRLSELPTTAHYPLSTAHFHLQGVASDVKSEDDFAQLPGGLLDRQMSRARESMASGEARRRATGRPTLTAPKVRAP